jgi:hypothetical protein
MCSGGGGAGGVVPGPGVAGGEATIDGIGAPRRQCAGGMAKRALRIGAKRIVREVMPCCLARVAVMSCRSRRTPGP